HMEIVQERLEREFDLSLIVTAPSVQYKVLTTAGEVLDIDNPSKLPSPDRIEQMDEPYVKSSVFVPTEFMTAIYKLAQEKRGKHRAVIPRQLFEVAIQAAIGSRVIARETVKAMGKNVTAKCYGGDITRKRKLLERQKEGKKRMKQVGKVEVPQEAFLSVLKS